MWNSASSIREAIASRDVSVLEVTEHFLECIDELNGELNAFLTVDADGARARARELDDRAARGDSSGLLFGVPVAVKDNMCTRGLRTTCGSKILGDFVPPYDAHVVERLRQEGAVILGKTNLDEFAMGSSTENSAFGPVRNPWDPERTPGGSSGGSAVAVAAGMAPLALGSDTGGSIRQPAALCGVVGMKPTYGLVSRYGLIAFASSLDQIGPSSNNVRDAAMLLNATAGHDVRDSTSAPTKTPDFMERIESAPEGLRIGVPKEYFGQGLDPGVGDAVTEALSLMESDGAQLVDISLPHMGYCVAVYYIVATAEASSNLARYDGTRYGHRAPDYDDMIHMYSRTRAEGFGDEVKRRIMLGTYALSSGYYDAYYLKAGKVRALISSDFSEAFKKVDLIASPTTPTVAFRLGEKIDDPLAMYLNDIYTISCNLAGICGISIPCARNVNNLPVGLQFVADRFQEPMLLQAARRYERLSGVLDRPFAAPISGRNSEK